MCWIEPVAADSAPRPAHLSPISVSRRGRRSGREPSAPMAGTTTPALPALTPTPRPPRHPPRPTAMRPCHAGHVSADGSSTRRTTRAPAVQHLRRFLGNSSSSADAVVAAVRRTHPVQDGGCHVTAQAHNGLRRPWRTRLACICGAPVETGRPVRGAKHSPHWCLLSCLLAEPCGSRPRVR